MTIQIAQELPEPGEPEAEATATQPQAARQGAPWPEIDEQGIETTEPEATHGETGSGVSQGIATEGDAAQSLDGPDVSSIDQWQQKLLPFMSKMILWLAVFFFVASLAQLAYLHVTIYQRSPLDTSAILQISATKFDDPSDRFDAAQFDALVQLEHLLIRRRYHQANVLLMSRVWVRYLGFVTGMILAVVGATFILGKMREPLSKIDTSFPVLKFSFAGSSPGIFLVLAGLALMITTTVVHRDIRVTDAPLYVGAQLPYLQDPVLPLAEEPDPGLPLWWPSPPNPDADGSTDGP